MYLVEVAVKASPIHGKGVFADEKIAKGKVVWKYTEGHDRRMTVEAFDELSHKARKAIEQTAYLSPQSDMWVIPPTDDPACFTNHSAEANLIIDFDPKVSKEALFIAAREIEVGRK